MTTEANTELSEEQIAEIAERDFTFTDRCERKCVVLSVAERDALCGSIKMLRTQLAGTREALTFTSSERENQLELRLSEVERERDQLRASRRVHELDNHHNALACGYCAGPLKDELERLKKLEILK